MRQQFADGRHLVGGQTFEHVFHVGVGVMPIESSRVYEGHHSGRSLPGTQAACEEPVVFPDGNRTDLPFEMIVIHRQVAIIQKPSQRLPTPGNPPFLQGAQK